MRNTQGMNAAASSHESESWLDASSPQGFGEYLARRMLAGALVVVAGALVLIYLTGARHEAAERDDDLAFTAALSLAPTENIGPLAVASSREALLWRAGEAPTVFTDDSPETEAKAVAA